MFVLLQVSMWLSGQVLVDVFHQTKVLSFDPVVLTYEICFRYHYIRNWEIYTAESDTLLRVTVGVEVGYHRNEKKNEGVRWSQTDNWEQEGRHVFLTVLWKSQLAVLRNSLLYSGCLATPWRVIESFCSFFREGWGAIKCGKTLSASEKQNLFFSLENTDNRNTLFGAGLATTQAWSRWWEQMAGSGLKADRSTAVRTLKPMDRLGTEGNKEVLEGRSFIVICRQ